MKKYTICYNDYDEYEIGILDNKMFDTHDEAYEYMFKYFMNEIKNNDFIKSMIPDCETIDSIFDKIKDAESVDIANWSCSYYGAELQNTQYCICSINDD